MASNGHDEPKTGNQNLNLLIKLLNMTTSDNDNVALMSARKANEQLAKFNTTWEKLLTGHVTIVADPFGPAADIPVVSRPAPTATPRPAPTAPPPRTPYTPSRPQPAVYQCAYCSAQFNNVGDRTAHETYTCTSSTAPRNKPDPQKDLSIPSYRGPSKYQAPCYKCLGNVPAGKGYLSHKTGGVWKVACGTGWGCAGGSQTKVQRQQSKGDMGSIVDSLLKRTTT